MNLLDIAIAKKMSGGGGSEPTIESLSVTENGTYTAPSGVDGYNPVTVNVPGITPSGTIQITQNGTVDVTQYASANVSVSGGGGGGGDHDAEDGIIDRTISGAYTNSRVTSIGNSVFYGCTSLTTVNFPNVTFIGNSAFYSCTSLTTANFPNVTMIWSSAFRNCISLESFYVLASSVATLGTSVFASTPMSLSNYLGYFGSIYVPASLVDTYKSARNWSAYADRITSYVE